MNTTYTPTLPDTIDVHALATAITEQVQLLSNPLYALVKGDQGLVRLAGLTEAFCLLTGNSIPAHEHSDEETCCPYMQALVDMCAAVAALDTFTATVDEHQPT